MARVILAQRPAHLSSDEAYAEVERCYGVAEVSDACAATIASWWQSPGAGVAFAELSTAGTFDSSDLLLAIHHERQHLRSGTPDGKALDMLATWVLSKLGRP